MKTATLTALNSLATIASEAALNFIALATIFGVVGLACAVIALIIRSL